MSCESRPASLQPLSSGHRVTLDDGRISTIIYAIPALWRNWQTQRIQNPSPIKRVGSSPTKATFPSPASFRESAIQRRNDPSIHMPLTTVRPWVCGNVEENCRISRACRRGTCVCRDGGSSRRLQFCRRLRDGAAFNILTCNSRLYVRWFASLAGALYYVRNCYRGTQ